MNIRQTIADLEKLGYDDAAIVAVETLAIRNILWIGLKDDEAYKLALETLLNLCQSHFRNGQKNGFKIARESLSEVNLN